MEQSRDKDVETIDQAESAEPEGSEDLHETDDNDEPELKLPDWIKPDPAAGDKGKLLYIEEWATKGKKFRKLDDLVMGAIVMLMGIIVVGIGIATLTLVGIIMLSGMGFIVVLLGYQMYGMSVRSMPFTVYERGITHCKVSFRHGQKRQEEFIPWNRIRRVDLTDSFVVKSMTLTFHKGKAMPLTYSNLSDPLEVMILFQSYIPEKIGESFSRYIGTGDERNFVSYPFPNRQADQRWVMPLMFSLMFTLAVGFFIGRVLAGRMQAIAIPLVASIFMPMSLFFIWLTVVKLDVRSQDQQIAYHAQAISGGVFFPRTIIGSFTRDFIDPIPWSRIRAVRLKLDPVFYSHQGEIQLTSGKTYRVPYKVYRSMVSREGFRSTRTGYLNTDPAPLADPVIRVSGRKLKVFLFLLHLPILPAMLIGWNPTILDVSSASCAGMIILFFLCVSAMPLLRYLKARKGELLTKGLTISEKYVSFPGDQGARTSIRREYIKGVRVVADRSHPFCEMITAKDTFKFSVGSVEIFMNAGIEVENRDLIDLFRNHHRIPPRSKKSPSDASNKERSEEHALPDTIEPGALLLAGDTASVRKQRRNHSIAGALLIFIGIFFLLFLLPPYYRGLVSTTCAQTCLLIIGLGLLCLGYVEALKINRTKSFRIYENGIVFPLVPPVASEIFVPFGRIQHIDENVRIFGKECVRFNIDEDHDFHVESSHPGLMELLDDINGKIGRPEFDCRDFDISNREVVEFYQHFISFAAFALGLGIAMLFMESFYSMDVDVNRWKLLYYGAPISLVLLVTGTMILDGTNIFVKKEGLGARMGERFFAVTVIFAVLMFSLGVANDTPTVYENEMIQSGPPETFLAANGNIEGRLVELNESLYIMNDTRLVISNSTIRFDLSPEVNASIWVAELGFLEIVNSTIESMDVRYGYGFEIYGGALIRDSRISGIYSHPEEINRDGGMEIYADDVTISNCTIANNWKNGVLISDASPAIVDCVFQDCRDDAIEMYSSNAKIENCTFRNNGWGIVIFERSRPTILGSRFLNNDHGIDIIDSSPVIANCQFENNTEYAIQYQYESTVHGDENIFTNNGDDVVMDEDSIFYFFFLMSYSLFFIGIFGAIVVLFVSRRRKRG